MDIQLCLDFFAVITYISDYYSKDDSGTMQFLIDALKDAQNKDLRSKLKKVGSVFLTHRQMGESEAYYRILPHMNLKGSNIQAVFAPTGFNPSNFLQRIDDDDTDENAIEVEGREGLYREKPSMYKKYLRRDCELQPELKDLCYAQFVKRYSSARKIPTSYTFQSAKFAKTYDSSGQLIHKDVIVTKEMDENEDVYKLPTYIKLNSPQQDEPSYMKIRSEAALRFHKFKKDKNLHEHLFSELQLYHPHTNLKKHGCKYNLEKEKSDLEICQRTYTKSQINKVKNRIMPFLENVEEGMEAAHELRSNIGDQLDPQNEQDRLECEDMGLEDNLEYAPRDFSGMFEENDTSSPSGLFKTVTLKSDEDIFKLIHSLDDAQRLVVDIAMKYIKEILVSRKTTCCIDVPRLIVQGGAGSGKSSVIHVVVQLVERFLRQSGDNLDNPYVLPLAFTGTAAANIDGMTLHSAFNFPFSNDFLSLPDKLRDQKRDLLKKLKLIIIDEFSMIKADMLYQIDLRLRELKENTIEPFGGCAVFMFGDILQLKPVMGKYVFDLPTSQNYHASFYIDNLWNTFKVVQLLTNHRQGEDHAYADVLNRIRSGNQTEDDYAILQQRVRSETHPDLPNDALYVKCCNEDVNECNSKKLEMLDGELHEVDANVRSTAQKNISPKINRDGSISNTPLQKHLKLKIGAPVMLTSNLDVTDCLTNGAIGKVVAFQYSSSAGSKTVKTVLIQFHDEKVGKNRRRNYAYLQQQYPDIPVTPIEMIEFHFSMSKKQTNNQMCVAIQFPLKLAFCCTAHKMQGQTVAKPKFLILDLRRVREPAQAYVMLSRVQALSQLFIIEEIPKEKIIPSSSAVTELQRLSTVALNNRLCSYSFLASLNIRSLPKHFVDLSNDFKIKQANIICIQETWCGDCFDNSHLQLDDFNLHLTNQGNGKGIATYCKKDFVLTGEFRNEKFQMSKFSTENVHVINVYRSHGACSSLFLNCLNSLVFGCDHCYIVGDFNIDFLKTKDSVVNWILSHGFKQIVQSATHEEGGLLDHVYVKSDSAHFVDLHWPYYSDHAGLCVKVIH